MSSTAFLALLMATFACIGFVLVIVMGRLGYSPFAWGLLGLLLGPIALLLALVEVRNDRPWWTRLVASGDPGGGPVDVLDGIDGSPESGAATTAALELLGGRVGRLTLVAVTDLDDSYAGREQRQRLQGELERQAETVRAWLGDGLSTLLLGSVASRLAARASVPVLVVGDRARTDRGERKPRSLDQADPRADRH